MRATSGSVYTRCGCRNHAFALALVDVGPGHPVPQALGDPQVRRDLGDRLLPRRASSTARRNSGGFGAGIADSPQVPVFVMDTRQNTFNPTRHRGRGGPVPAVLPAALRSSRAHLHADADAGRGVRRRSGRRPGQQDQHGQQARNDPGSIHPRTRRPPLSKTCATVPDPGDRFRPDRGRPRCRARRAHRGGGCGVSAAGHPSS